jgi:subtilisin family serine protease
MTCKERILSDEYLDLVVNFPIPEYYNDKAGIDYCYHQVTEDIGIVYAKRSELPKARFTQATYSFYPKCYGLMAADLGYLSASGILSVQDGALNLTGKGVTIGFVDTGIRYNEDIFKDYAGRSRILSIWDQTIQTGTPPEGFAYGSEYTWTMINEGTVPSTDANGHGSVMASLAAGNGIGAAPECNIVVVKLKEAKDNIRDYYKIPLGVPCYSETDILQGIQYLQNYSKVLKSPLVICLGIGTSWGDHTGSGILDSYINYIGGKKSNVVILPSGNEGNGARHFHGELSRDNTYRDVQLRVGDDDKGFVMDLWGDAPYYYNAVITSPGGETISWNNPKNALPQEYTFIYEKTKILIDYLLVEQTSGSELIRFKFITPTRGVWNIRISSPGNIIGGAFDIWLPIGEFLSSETYFLEPNPDITITEPAYVRNAITVANYNFTNNSIASNSGRGYSRNKAIVPDIAAPGVNIPTPFGTYSGSSLSAAITAGACAQFLQWAVIEQHDILVNSLNVKNYFIRGAKRDKNKDYPNRQWGYGRLDLEGIFEFLAGL